MRGHFAALHSVGFVPWIIVLLFEMRSRQVQMIGVHAIVFLSECNVSVEEQRKTMEQERRRGGGDPERHRANTR